MAAVSAHSLSQRVALKSEQEAYRSHTLTDFTKQFNQWCHLQAFLPAVQVCMGIAQLAALQESLVAVDGQSF